MRTGGMRTSSPLHQFALGFGAAAVDPHLAGPQQPVDMRFGHATQLFDQEIIDPLAVLR